MLEAPHTQASFVMREMGYSVARKHALKLRTLVLLVGFALPAVLVLLSIVAGATLATLLMLLAVLTVGFGVVVERWLFFAEAWHVVTLYYGAPSA